MADVEGVNLKITGDSSDVIKQIEKVLAVLSSIKDAKVDVTVNSAGVAEEIERINSALNNVNDSNINITVDNSQALQSVQETENAVSNVDANIQVHAENQEVIDEVQERVNNLSDTNINITADSTQAVDAVNAASNAIESIQGTNIPILADRSQAVQEAEEVSATLENIPDANAMITADGSQAVQTAHEVQNELNNIELFREITITMNREQILQQLEEVRQAANINANVNINTEGINRAGNAILQAGERLGANFSSAFMKDFSKISAGLENIGSGMERVFGGIFSNITRGLTAIVGASGVLTLAINKSLNIGGGFEAQMTSVKVISGATADELEALTQKAREMGATLPITAAQSAEAMTVLAQRGTSVKDILTSVTDVTSLSISQGIDLASAADLLGSTIKNFGFSMEDATRITNYFNNACNSSALNMSKLIESMKYVAPAASAVGISIEEALASMEALADSGLTGEMIGTGLSMVLSKLATQSRVMGVEIRNLDGTMRPLKEIFSELRQQGFSLAEATTIFGQRGAKAALNLSKFSDSLATAEQNLQRMGATEYAVEEKMKTWPNVWNAFKSATEELHIEIFEQIKTQSKEAVSGIANLTRTLSAWLGETKIAEKSLNAFLDGLGFKIPTDANLKKYLDELNIDYFVERIKNFGSTLHDIGESISNLYNTIKTPLGFLIENIDTFGSLAFWGWILGAGLRVPATILGIASAFIQLHTALQALSVLNLTNIIGFLTNPVFLTVGFAAGAITSAVALADAVHDAFTPVEERIADFKDKIARETDEINEKLVFEVKTNFKTGFEELPTEFLMASKNLRQAVENRLSDLREVFKERFSQIYKELNNGSIENFSDDLAKTLSEALHGGEEAYKQLQPEMKKVIDFLKETGYNATQTADDFDTLIASYKNFERLRAVTNVEIAPETSKFELFTKSINDTINSLVNEFPNKIEELQNFIGSQDLELILSVQLDQAQKQLKKFIKDASEQYAIPEDIVSKGVLDRLKEVAKQGNQTAQSLANSWDNSMLSLDIFMEKAREAMEYLNASPEKFIPALNKLAQGVQKIDPLTGKLTEGFKKAYNAAKELANAAFDKLSQRIQRLRKAFEGGFIDERAFQEEYKNLSEKLKVQVATEIKPEDFSNMKQYYAVLASEFTSRLQDLGGEAMVNMWRDECYRLADYTGEGIGKAIADSVKNLKVDATLQGQQQQSQGFNVQEISKVFTQFGQKIEQFNIDMPKQFTAKDYTNNFSNVISEIRNVSANIQTVRTVVTALESVIKAQSTSTQTFDNSGVISAIQEVKNAISTLPQNNSDIISAVNAIETVIKSQQAQDVNLDTNGIISAINSLEGVFNSKQTQNINLEGIISAINSLENAVKSQPQSNTDFSSIISAINNLEKAIASQNNADVVTAVKAVENAVNSKQIPTFDSSGIISAVNAVDNTVKSRPTYDLSTIISAIRSIESAVKNISGGNNFDIDINQQGFMVQKKSDADYLARSTMSALRSGIGNGGI